VDFLKPQSYILPEGEADEGYKLAQMLRNVELSGMGMDVGKAGTLMQGRLGYNFPVGDNSTLGVGASGTSFADNRFNIPATVNSVDLSYGTPDQRLTLGYYPNKSQFMGQPMGQGGVSLMYRKQFD
jgi:hypothetical protein